MTNDQLSTDLASFLTSLNPELISQLTDGSLDLTSYQSVIESELQALEAEHIAIHREVIQDDVQCLKREVDKCEAILGNLQETLLGFSADLSGLSGDIQHLQNQSLAMALQLSNRTKAEAALTLFLQKVVIPPNMANAIIYDDVDAIFVACVMDLEAKYEYVHGDDDASNPEVGEDASTAGKSFVPPPPSQTVAGREVKVHLEQLRLKAIERTRQFFLHKLGELRRPKTNVRMIQVNSLLKFAPLIDFLRDAAPEVYQEIKDVYTESMGKTVHALFRVYLAQLSRLDAKVVNRHDAQLIAIEESALKSHGSSNSDTIFHTSYSPFSTPVKTKPPTTDSFHLGDRADVLDACAQCAKPILVHLAQSEHMTYPYEQLFRSVMMHLIDSLTNEYVFTLQFFRDHGRDVFHKIFNRAFSLVLETIENYLFNCHDALCLLLMIKVNHLHQKTMRKRRVNDETVDNFFERVNQLLWPRFKMLLENQIRSLRTANGKKLGLSSSSSSSSNSAAVELHSHYIARRYAEFTSSLLLIMQHQQDTNDLRADLTSGRSDVHSRETRNPPRALSSAFSSPFRTPKSFESATDRGRTPPDMSPNQPTLTRSRSGGDMILDKLSSIQQETISLLKRVADEHSDSKRKTIFLINNLDQIVNMFQERRVFAHTEVCAPFEKLLTQQRELFVEEELMQMYSKIINFVQQFEGKIQAGTVDLNQHNRNVESLVREFALNWKKGIEQINKNVLSYFSNFRNGLEILKQVLTQLLLYYTRFQDILRKGYRGKVPEFCKDLISTTQILAEIKKYALSI